MDILVIKEKIDNKILRSFLEHPFPDMVKLVVDIDKKKIALGGEMHADAEEVLLEEGSAQKDLWGANIYPDETDEHKIEYSSFINIRPSQNNRSMEVGDSEIRRKMEDIIRTLIEV